MNPNQTQAPQTTATSPATNTSGQGKASVIPSEIRGWSWGAFLLNWIWGIGNQTYIALLMFVPLVNVVMIFVLGAKGREWAWRNKHWESVEKFKKVQKIWAVVGLCLVLVFILFVAATSIFTFSATSAPVNTADVFLNELNSNQVEAAYNSISQDAQNQTTLQQFESYVSANPILTEIKSESFDSRSINNSEAVISGTLVGNDGATSPIVISEEEQNGAWQVAGINLHPGSGQ